MDNTNQMDTSRAAAFAHFRDPNAIIIEYNYPGDDDAWWLNDATGELYPQNEAAVIFWKSGACGTKGVHEDP